VDGKPAVKFPKIKSPIIHTNDDFGGFLGSLADPGTKPEYSWNGWDTIGGKRALTFRYRTPGGYEISNCGGVFGLSACSTHHYARRGEIWLAEDGLRLLRVTIEPENVPGFEETRTVDYAAIAIAGQDYILPVADVFERITPKVRLKNESTYTDYKKFSAESTLKADEK
jgi:hypothetical protein